MQKLEVTLETVTPLFLGGAEPKEKPPELRPPAFRGALRYWWRATLGGVLGDRNIQELHQLESAVFGSTDYGSPITLRLMPLNNHIPDSGPEGILPHKQGKAAGSREAFKVGQKFKLEMQQIHGDNLDVWRAACSTLHLALTFGGVGLRSRRGHGTLKIIKSSEESLASSFPTSLEGWKQHVTRVVSGVVNSAQTLAQSQKVTLAALPIKPASYPCATKNGLIWICDLEPKLLKSIDAVIKLMNTIPKRDCFGRIGSREGRLKRQASPLWVRPIQIDNHYGLLFAVLASDFEGSDYNFVRSFLEKNFKGENIPVKGWNA